MSFINKQEEVIKLTLTQHGKHLLSKGQFIPHCYQMFDDDIIYDIKYAGGQEHQNAITDRIKQQPRRGIQHVVSSINERHGKETEDIASGQQSEFDSLVYGMPVSEKEKVLGFPLANMKIGSQNLPRWNVNVYESEIENHSSIEYETFDGAAAKIPQLDFNPTYSLVRDSTNVVSQLDLSDYMVDEEVLPVDPSAENITFVDGSFYQVVKEDICLLINEENSHYFSENFDIEVYEILDKDTETEKLKKLNSYNHLFSITYDSRVPIPQNKEQGSTFYNISPPSRGSDRSGGY